MQLGDSFLVYKDRGFLYLPKLAFAPFLRQVDDLIKNNFYQSKTSFVVDSVSRTYSAVVNDKECKKLYKKAAKMCLRNNYCVLTTSVDKFYNLWIKKLIHARTAECFSSSVLLRSLSTGKPVKGGQTLRDKLYPKI